MAMFGRLRTSDSCLESSRSIFDTAGGDKRRCQQPRYPSAQAYNITGLPSAAGIAVMLLFFTLVLATTGSIPNDPCPGTTTPEVNACQKVVSDQADADLNRYYQAALKRLKQDDQELARRLVASQRAWIAYRDAECGAVYDNWSGGTIRTSMALRCQAQLSRLRSYSIWENWLTYMDSTPPILPRPNVEASIADR
jgi:uncharacterized protein YecT (DUF1311 family)